MAHFHKITLLLIVVMSICLISRVKALGVAPDKLEIVVEKGKETRITRNLEVLNPENKPIHVVCGVSGSISKFVTLDPKEFDLPAGPGIKSLRARPSRYVTAVFKIPREVPEKEYKGAIIFTQSPVKGGVLGTGIRLTVPVTLRIGKMAEAKFPTYLNLLTGLLIVLMGLAIVLPYTWRRVA